MSSRRPDTPSAIKTGLLHAALSVGLFSLVGAASAGAIQMAGNANSAGPNVQLAVFDSAPDSNPALKTRLRDSDLTAIRLASLQPVGEDTRLTEPSLGVEYREEIPMAQGAGETASAPAATPVSGTRDSVRVNGRTVYVGESYSQVETLTSLPESPIAGLHERNSNGRVPMISEDGREIADAYARPHYNRAGQPSVSLILGGLGINYTHTNSAIEDLPPEVTLSFAAHASGLQTWINRARAAGHEVLIELPMEPYDFGRVRPHPHALRANLDGAANVNNLERILALGHGYFGVVNYQGDKFASNSDAAQTMFDALRARGVAFFEDGSIPGDDLRVAAGTSGALFAKADYVVDSRISADAMQSQLSLLEAAAIENGGALGTAIAYPLTIDILIEWTEELDAKGIVLAPASSLQAVPQTLQAEVDMTGAPEIPANLP